MRHRVTLKRESVTRDTDGAEVVTLHEVATVWAAVEQLSGAERFIRFGAQDQATASTRITIRYHEEIDPGLRVEATLWGVSRTWDVLECRPDPTWRRQWVLICDELNVAVERLGDNGSSCE